MICWQIFVFGNEYINGIAIPADMYAYWYLFGVDEDYSELFDEENYAAVTGIFRNEQDAIYSLVVEYSYYNGTVEVIRK